MLFAAQAGYARYAAIMIDADNGNILHEVDATQSWYPASLTKVMTLYMTFEALQNGQIHFFDAMRTSSHAASQPTSKLGLRVGEYLTVRDAIYAIITRSANDAAVVLAERLGGTEENFAVKMTNKAHSLGMSNTRFMNATGLPNDWQVTTSRDMAMLAWKIQRHFPEYYQHFSAHSFNYKGTELRGINKFVAHYPGAEGMKTGFTCGSGYNLIASAQQNGKRLIGVVLGGMTSAERYQLMYRMMDAGFDNRYEGGAQERHINSMPAGFAGTPPYQLSCGSKAFLHSVSNYNQNNHRSVRRYTSRYKFTVKNKKVLSRVQTARSKYTFKSGKIGRVAHNTRFGKHNKIKPITLASRNKSSSNSLKRVSSKNTSNRATSTKHKIVTASIKSYKTRYRHIRAR